MKQITNKEYEEWQKYKAENADQYFTEEAKQEIANTLLKYLTV